MLLERSQYTQSHNTAHGEKPDDDRKNVLQSLGVLSNRAVYSDGSEKFEADVEIEDGADTDGAKEADKDCLLLFFDLPDVPVQSEDDGETAED